jgi:type IV secretion system protein VirB6
MAASIAELSSNLADNINQIIEDESVDFISNAFNNIWSELSSFILLLVTLYIVIMGYGVMRGLVATPVNTFLENIVKLAIIYGLVSTWSLFSFYVVDVITNTPDALAGVMSGTENTGRSATSQVGSIYNEAVAIVNQIKEQRGLVLPYVLGGIVFVSATFMMAYAIFLIVLSKIAITVLVGIAPLFIIFLMFKVTRQMFEAWLKQVINYSFVVVLTVSVLGLTNQVAQRALNSIPESGITLGHVVPACVVFFMVFMLLMQVQNIASSLAGGLALSTGNIAQNIGRKMDLAASRAAGAAVGSGYKVGKAGVNKGYQTIKNRATMSKIKESK